jgi:hypothetical protein
MVLTHAHISLFVSEENLYHRSFSKISFKAVNRPHFHGPRSQFMQRAFLFSQTSAKRSLNVFPMGFQTLEIGLQSSLRRWFDMKHLVHHVNDTLEKSYRPYDLKIYEP